MYCTRMCLLILFEALVEARIQYASQQIACVGLVHISLRFSRLCTRVFHLSHYEY